MDALHDLPDKVLATYDACIESGEVKYYPSEVNPEDNELKTEIRLCESLSQKPGPKESGSDDKKDVFAKENWTDQMFIKEFDGGQGEEFGILLNKYAVVPLHFLIVTKEQEHQTAPLSPPQLLAAYQIIQAFRASRDSAIAKTPPSDLLCFYNCGEQSGASQAHKHVQFAPTSGEGSLGYFPMERAADAYNLSENDRDKPFKLDQVPYAHYVRRFDEYLVNSTPSSIPPTEIMQYLQQVYLSLLDVMLDGLRSLPEGILPDDPNAIKLGKGLSYNLLMTKKHMHIIPRREKVYKMPVPKAKGEESPKASTEPAIIGCNALAYTGTVLVKSKTDVKRLASIGGVIEVLETCAYPKTDSLPSVTQDLAN